MGRYTGHTEQMNHSRVMFLQSIAGLRYQGTGDAVMLQMQTSQLSIAMPVDCQLIKCLHQDYNI